MFNLSKLAGLSFVMGVVGVLNCCMASTGSFQVLPYCAPLFMAMSPITTGIFAVGLGIASCIKIHHSRGIVSGTYIGVTGIILGSISICGGLLLLLR